MLDPPKQIEVITKGLDYWLHAGSQLLNGYGIGGEMKVASIRKEIGEYTNIKDVHTIAAKFKKCLSSTALALRQLDWREGLEEFNKIMAVALPAGYEAAYGQVRGSGVDGFLRYVIDRDRMLDYEVGGRKISDTEFEYWIRDPFIDLKDIITEDEYQIISTHGYVWIKMNFFLDDDAPNWFAHLKESPWRGHRRSLWRMKRREAIGVRHATVEAYATP